MFGIGGFELFIILIFAFLIFGPEKLPEIGRTVGRAIAKFREAQQDMNETLGSDKIFDPNNPDEPFKDPIEALDKFAKRQEEKQREKEKAASDAKAAKDRPAEESADASEGEAPRQESFTERKARYERERAARKAAEAKAAEPAAPAAPAEEHAEPAAPAAPAEEPAVSESSEGGER